MTKRPLSSNSGLVGSRSGATTQPVMRQLLLPLTFLLLLLVGGFGLILLNAQQDGMSRFSQQVLDDTVVKLGESLSQQSRAMASLEALILRDPELRDALKRRDRQALLVAYKAVFAKLHEAYGITHFYFQRPDRVNLLRVHKPEKHGDLIERFTTREAERTGKTAAGIELGPLGTFTLRVAQPVFDGDTLIGYLELGKEIEDILTTIHEGDDMELAVVIEKDVLNRSEWEEGMSMLNRENHWEQFSDHVMSYSSQPNFPANWNYFITEKGHSQDTASVTTKFNGKTWRVLSTPLEDAAAVMVGELLIFLDVSESVARFNRLRTIGAVAAVVLLSILLALLLVVLQRVDRNVRWQQQSLRSANEFQRTLLESSFDLISVLDRDGIIQSVNRLQPGQREAEVVGQSAAKFVTPEEREDFERGFQSAIDTGQPQTGETTMELADGRHHYLTRMTPVQLSDREGSVVLFATDITAHMRAEEGLRRTQKMDAIGQLTGGIAHDFHNLLGIILGNLSLLERNIPADEKAQKRLFSIQKAAERAANLTRQILGFSRSKAAQRSITNINRVIAEMDNLISRAVTPEVEVECQFADDLWMTKIDPGDFEDALLNLSINARDAMTGHGHLTIETRNVSLDAAYGEQNPGISPGQYVELAVSDSGEGIPLALQERIFEPFYTTKEQGKGTGLGLAMVYGFVKRSKGFIKCYSEVSVGTTFRLYLPRVNGEELQVEQGAKESEELPRGRETILVVDDEVGLVELATELLEEQGYRVLTAHSGREALEQLAKEPTIELLFSDVVMPGGINGYQLAEQATTSWPELRILFTSGYTEKAASHNGQPYSNANLLSKPYTQVELVTRVRMVLDGQQKNNKGAA